MTKIIYLLIILFTIPTYAENLIEAIVLENIEKIETYIKEGEVNKRDYAGATPLTLAIATKNSKIVELLLRNQADVNSVNDFGWTPFIVAADIGNVNILKLLYKTGKITNINATNNYGETAFIRATINGHVSVLKYLNKTVKVNTEMKQNQGYSALILAIRYSNEKAVKYLIKTFPKQVNIPDNRNLTPLAHAFLVGDGKIINTLLKVKNIDINTIDSRDGNTPFLIAITTSDKKTLAKLVKLGANINQVAGNTETSLMKAISAGNIEAVEFLMNFKVDVLLKNRIGLTALDYAERSGDVTILKLVSARFDNLSDPKIVAREQQAREKKLAIEAQKEAKEKERQAENLKKALEKETKEKERQAENLKKAQTREAKIEKKKLEKEIKK